MKTEILTYLKETDGYLSGQELCERLGVSRTAVWKAIRRLEEEGYEIEAVRNKGYRLVKSADAYSETAILAGMKTLWAGKKLMFLDRTDSTNNHLRRLAEEGAGEGTLVVAEQQTAGKGRRGRQWISPEGSGIWMSFLLRPEFSPKAASMLTLVAALAVREGILQATGLESGIKWPNDLVINGRKICGILTEMSTEEDRIRYVVIGIGINVNTAGFPPEIGQTATSLYLESEKKQERTLIIQEIMAAWERYYETFMETLDLSSLKEAYNRSLVNLGSQVSVLLPSGDYSGVSLGIDDEGGLLVDTGAEVRTVVSGEVSVRGVYGYV